MKKNELNTKLSKTKSELSNNVKKVRKKALDNVCKTINATDTIKFCNEYNPNCPIYEPSINIAHAILEVYYVASKYANAYYKEYLNNSLIPECVISACKDLKIDPESDMYEEVKKSAISQIIRNTKKIVRKKIAKETELYAFQIAICEASGFAHRAHNLDIPIEELIYTALEQMIVYLTDNDENDDEIIRRDIDFDKLPSMLQSIAERLAKEFKNCN